MCPHSTEKVKKKGDSQGMGGEKGVLVSAVSEDSIRGERPHEGVWREKEQEEVSGSLWTESSSSCF